MTDRKYIENPLKQAPPPVIIRQEVKPSPVTNTLNEASSNLTASGKKKYGKSDVTNSPSRSRSATKELICMFSLLSIFFRAIFNRIFLFLLVPPDDSLMCKPEFKKTLTNLTIKDGEELLLQCIVEGDPEPQISWSKNGNKISSSEIIDLKYKNGVASLRIAEVYPEDEGEYVCKATNSVGSTETKSKLTIQRKC